MIIIVVVNELSNKLFALQNLLIFILPDHNQITDIMLNIYIVLNESSNKLFA